MEEEEIELLSDDELAKSFVGDAFSMYMKEVFSYRLLSMDENKELARNYRKGDSYALEKLVNHNLRLVVNMAFKYRERITHMQLLDVIQEGNMGLMRAARDYDPEIGAFSTYANWWIRQAITRSISDKESEIRKPVHVQDMSYKYKKLMAQKKNLSDNEICKELGISQETLDNVRHALSISEVSMNQTIDDEDKTELGDFLSSSHDDYEDVINRMSTNTLFLALKETLTDLEYYVIYNRILSDTRITLEDVAINLGLTRERVRQIEAKALKKAKPLMENSNRMKQVIDRLRDRENVKIDLLRIEPIEPGNIIKYLFIKDSLSDDERKLLHFIYFGRYNLNYSQLASIFKMNVKEFKNLYNELLLKIEKKFKHNLRFNSYRENMIKNYGTQIFNLDLSSDVKFIDYDFLRSEYSSLSYTKILELCNMVDFELNKDEKSLLERFFSIPERISYSKDAILRDLNLAVFGYKGRNTNVPKNKLYEVYKKNLDDYSEEQRMFLECYFFEKRDKSEFKTTYKDSSLFYRYYYLIDRLERTYFNIYRYFDNNFTLEQYTDFRRKFKDKFGKEKIELLDLFYGYKCKALTIPEIAEMYGEDYIKMHDKISNARESAIFTYSGFSQRLDIDKRKYKPYILDPIYSFTEETRTVLKMYIVQDKTYDEISKELGLTKYRISNIVTDGIRKIDNYRFGLSSVFRITELELDEFFKLYDKYFNDLDRRILKMKHLKYMENSEIASRLGVPLLSINDCSSRFNKFYFGYKIQYVDITIDDVVREINRHPSESLLDERKKKALSYFYGIKNGYNLLGEKLTRDGIKERLGITKNVCFQVISSAINDIKGRKINMSRPIGLYIERDELDRLLDDYRLPISDKERDIICYLFELKGYPYKTIEQLSEVFGDTRASLSRRYQRAIVSIYKYMNNEIEGKISYDNDILPNMKYFCYSDRRIIDMYYRDGYTCEMIAKEFKVSFEKMYSVVERIRVNLFDLLNNSKCKKFDFDYYMKVRNEADLPFFGERERTITIFDLFYGMSDELRIGVPEIKKQLKLELETSAINKAANNMMLSVCKHQAGIRSSKTFTYDEIEDYYNRHKDEMPFYHKQFYLRYFSKVENVYRLNGNVPGVSYVILYDLLKENNPDIYSFDNLDRDTVIRLIKKYSNEITGAIKRELMAIYEITPREFMNGKDINHVYKILASLDEKIKDKGLEIKTKKKD